jgi:alkylresorcinol/alkylpyrone synthase
LRVSQRESLQFVLKKFSVKESTKVLYEKLFKNPSIQTRHFALDKLEEVLETNCDKINARFEKWSARLGAEALDRALKNAGLGSSDLDFLAVTTCTGYICPGISSHLTERLGLRPDVRSADIVGMGCGAAVPALEQAHNFLNANPGAIAAVVGVEICSAAMYSDDAADLAISNAIFGDGAAAAVLGTRDKEPSGEAAAFPQLLDFSSVIIPEWRDTLRFKTQNGYLRNVLGKDVPRQAAEALERLVFQILSPHGLSAEDIGHWIVHSGGEKILNAIEEKLRLPPDALRSSRNVLRDYGNISSPTVLFVLAEEMRRNPPRPGRWGLIASFGAGFSAHAALVRF